MAVKHKYLPNTPEEARQIALGSLGVEALQEALAMCSNEDARKGMALLIATHGRKYNSEARAVALKLSK